MGTEEKYVKLIKNIERVGMPANLEGKVLARIRRELRMRMTVFGGVAIASLASCVWAGDYFAQSVSRSGFLQYLTLAVSDNGMLLAYWREFAFSLVESLPIVATMIALGAVGFFIWSFNNALKNNHGYQKFA